MATGDSESDVSKALAAFGAPPLKYRSFTHAAIKSAPADAGGVEGMPAAEPAVRAAPLAPAPLASAPLAPAPLVASRVPPPAPMMLRPAPLAPAPAPVPPPAVPVAEPARFVPADPEPDVEIPSEPAVASMPPPAPVAFAAEPLQSDFLASELVSPPIREPEAPAASDLSAVEPGVPDGDIPLPRLFRLLSAPPAERAQVGMRDVFRRP